MAYRTIFIFLPRDGIDTCTTTSLLVLHFFHFAFISYQKFMSFICVGPIRTLSYTSRSKYFLQFPWFFPFFLSFFQLHFFPFVVIFAIFQFLCFFLCHFHPQCIVKMTSSVTWHDTRLCIQGIEMRAKSLPFLVNVFG